MSKLSSIKTNIITGFLGVGKTTIIQHLLDNKPQAERWAVLVNEFGEIGIDGNLIRSNNTTDSGVFVQELPGGCLCCTQGVPTRVALNTLLQRARPDRLLIEPTGLGHPKQILGLLMDECYQGVLDIRATIALVDARKMADSSILDNELLIQQLEVADVIVANKADLYASDSIDTLKSVLTQCGLDEKPLEVIRHGKLEQAWLERAANLQSIEAIPQPAMTDNSIINTPMPYADYPAEGFIKREHQTRSNHSVGWIFKPDFVFDYSRISSILNQLDAPRMKAIFITDKGVFAYSMTDSVLTELELDDTLDSRIELINASQDSLITLESQILETRLCNL